MKKILMLLICLCMLTFSCKKEEAYETACGQITQIYTYRSGEIISYTFEIDNKTNIEVPDADYKKYKKGDKFCHDDLKANK